MGCQPEKLNHKGGSSSNLACTDNLKGSTGCNMCKGNDLQTLDEHFSRLTDSLIKQLA
jgi:hypothetical protein